MLIVEDDDALAGLLERYTRRLGYEPIVAGTAGRAREVFAGNAGVELALVDLTLPDEPGEKLAEELLRARESLRVVLMSGYPGSVGLLPEEFRSRAEFLSKPFLPAELQSRIENLKTKQS